MPISPKNRSLYPPDWREISSATRVRAGNCCEGSPAYPLCRARNHEPHPVTGSITVLTVAHLNHDPSDCLPENLRAWCQRCHLTYDAKFHAENARKKRFLKCAANDLFEEVAS
jgi:hypothetical protein